MDIKALEQLIKDAAKRKHIAEEAIVEDLADILKMKYGISIMARERDLLDEVKMKIITRLYNSEFQTFKAGPDVVKSYKLDLLEADYYETACDELLHEGLIKLKNDETALTKEGIMKFKIFYGEI
jgi:hypothetical protein